MKSELFNYLFIFIIGFISIPVIKRDVKKKKIRNADIIRGFMVGIILYLIAVGTGNAQLSYIQNVFSNSISAAVVVYVLWLLNFWPAGDAKFFMMLSFLLPLSFYSNSYFPIFPSFILLVNIFCVAFFYLMLSSVYYLCCNIFKGKVFKAYFSRFLEFRKKGNGIFKEIKMFAWKILKSLFVVYLFLIPSMILGRNYANNTNDFFPNYLIGFLSSILVVHILNVYLEDTQDCEIFKEELKEGMALSSKTLNGSFLKKEFLAKIGALRADGLNAYQVAEMCDIFRTNGVNKVWVQKHVPFSPWILSGVVVTIFLKGSLLELIFNLF